MHLFPACQRLTSHTVKPKPGRLLHDLYAEQTARTKLKGVSGTWHV